MTASRLRPVDLVGVAVDGLRGRRLRASLSALGIAIGIAAMVAVVGISSSSQAQLLSALDKLGTNLLAVTPGESVFARQSVLPATATAAIARRPDVESAGAVTTISGVTVRRSPYVDEAETNGIGVRAAGRSLAATLHSQLRAGRWLSRADERYPTVVLGDEAARRLGVRTAGTAVWIGDRWFVVVGRLAPQLLAPELDNTAMMTLPTARREFATRPNATTIYVATDPSATVAVRELLGATANPRRPEEVRVSRPSDAIEARAAAQGAFTSLLLGLGVVALAVGGVGIANVMVVAVLERRGEIGLRRALGARRVHISAQFVCEALLLAAAGGLVGTLVGVTITAGWAQSRAAAVVIPPLALVGAPLAAMTIGVLAGLGPALRASRLAPTEALRTV